MDWNEFLSIQNRREFLRGVAGGIGLTALYAQLQAGGLAAAPRVDANPLSPKKPHFAPKARHVIYMFMEGGPSQYELFDPKPALEKYDGTSLPPEMTKDLKLAFIKPTAKVMASRYKFSRYGQCGMEISARWPTTSR